MLEHVPFVKLLDVQVVDVGEGSCRAKLPFHEQLTQYYHDIHGGVIATLADTVIYLAQTTLNGITKNTVTIELKVNYLAPPKQDDLYADASVLKNGKKTIYAEVRITNLSGKLVAHATGTYMRLDYDMRE